MNWFIYLCFVFIVACFLEEIHDRRPNQYQKWRKWQEKNLKQSRIKYKLGFCSRKLITFEDLQKQQEKKWEEREVIQ